MSRRVNITPAALAVVAVLLASLPVIVATVRAVAGGWRALDDNALFVIRARDVLTDDHPLLGTSTSASALFGDPMNNPGPLLFDLYAVPVKLAGDAGLAVAVAMVNVASILGIAWLARRLGGPGLVVVAMVPAAALGWAMGSELLFDPWQPHSLLFPFLLFLVAAWAVAAGDLVAAPVAALVGSLLLQTYVVYAYVVPVVAVVAGVAAAVALRRDRARSPDDPLPPRNRRHVVLSGVTALVLVACWAQPALEQVTADGRGNLARIATAVGDGEPIGLVTGARLVATVVAVPPWRSRDTFADAFLPVPGGEPVGPGALARVPSTSTGLVALVLVCVLLVVAFVRARRRGDRVATAGVVVVAGTLAGALLTARSMPLGVFGVSAHTLRWLWPVSILTTVVVVLGLAGPARTSAGWRAGWFALVVVLAGANLPHTAAAGGPAISADAVPVARRLAEAMDAVENRGEVLFDGRTLPFGNPFGTAVLAELQRRGVPFAVDDPVLIRQFGPARAADGDERLRLFLTIGDAARQVEPGSERVAFATALDRDDLRELLSLRGRVRRLVHLSARGEIAHRAGRLPAVPAPDGTYDVEALRATGALWPMLEGGLLDLGVDGLARWAELELLDHRRTVAVVVEPTAAR